MTIHGTYPSSAREAGASQKQAGVKRKRDDSALSEDPKKRQCTDDVQLPRDSVAPASAKIEQTDNLRASVEQLTDEQSGFAKSAKRIVRRQKPLVSTTIIKYLNQLKGQPESESVNTLIFALTKQIEEGEASISALDQYAELGKALPKGEAKDEMRNALEEKYDDVEKQTVDTPLVHWD
jgi:hypothetical protein